MSKNFNDIYPTVEDVIADMHETIANICDTKAERNVLIRRMNEYVAQGLDKVDLYQKMQIEFDVHLK